MLATLLIVPLMLGTLVPRDTDPESKPSASIVTETAAPDSGRVDPESEAEFVVCHQSQCEAHPANHENYMDLGCTSGGAGVFGLLGLIPLLAARRR